VIDGHSTDLLDGENGDRCMSRVLWRRDWVGIRVWKWENGRMNMVCGDGLDDVKGGRWIGLLAVSQYYGWPAAFGLYYRGDYVHIHNTLLI
jgi:hypothetical protein